MDKEFLAIRELDKFPKIYEDIAVSIRYILFSTYEKLYIPLSATVECEYADRFIKENRELFKKHFFIAMSDKSLDDYLYYKQDQYAHNIEMAKKYQSYKFEHLVGLPCRTKYTDTTVFIEHEMVNQLMVKRDMLHGVDFYIEKIMERKKAAITHHLFEDIYASKDIEKRQQKKVNSLITELYITTYMEDFNGDIVIPHQVGLRDFSDLSRSFPVNDMTMWYRIYDRIGCGYFIENCSQDNMIEIFKSEIFIGFINIMCKCVSTIEKEKIFGLEKIISCIPRFGDITDLSYESFLKRIETVTKILLEYNIDKYDFEKKGGILRMNKERMVFVVYGRNEKYTKSVFDFLRSLDLRPLEWERVVEMTGKGAPETFEIVKKGIENSNGVIILYTGDEEARLLKELAKEGEVINKVLQPRQNVVFEAGYAMAVSPNKTIILKIGKVNISSDLKGLNYIELNDSIESRRNFKNRLKTIGLPIDEYTGEWETAGDFSII